MKTTYDIVDILWQKLKNSSLKGLITGGVYKRRRPLGSVKEDVVINSPSANNQQLQYGLANVNIFVPPLVINTATGSEKVTNHVRMKELANMAVMELSSDQDPDDDFIYDVQQQLEVEDEDGTVYTNIRIDFHIINITN